MYLYTLDNLEDLSELGHVAEDDSDLHNGIISDGYLEICAHMWKDSVI